MFNFPGDSEISASIRSIYPIDNAQLPLFPRYSHVIRTCFTGCNWILFVSRKKLSYLSFDELWACPDELALGSPRSRCVKRNFSPHIRLLLSQSRNNPNSSKRMHPCLKWFNGRMPMQRLTWKSLLDGITYSENFFSIKCLILLYTCIRILQINGSKFSPYIMMLNSPLLILWLTMIVICVLIMSGCTTIKKKTTSLVDCHRMN